MKTAVWIKGASEIIDFRGPFDIAMQITVRSLAGKLYLVVIKEARFERVFKEETRLALAGVAMWQKLKREFEIE